MNLTWFQWKVMKSCEFDMNSIKSYEICWICHDFTEKVWNLSWAAVGPGPSFWNDLMKTLVWWMWLHPLKLHVVIYRLPHCSSRHKEEGHDILHICIFFMYVHTTRDVVLCQMSVPATLYTKTQINLQHDRWKQFLQSITSIPHAGLNFCAFARLRANTRRTGPFTNLPVRIELLRHRCRRGNPYYGFQPLGSFHRTQAGQERRVAHLHNESFVKLCLRGPYRDRPLIKS